MPEAVYEVVAQAARYWFAFLMLVIVWRSYRWFRRDRRQRKKRLRLLPDAGFVGELVVLRGGDELAPGTVLPLPREGMLGFLRTCDVCVPVTGVGKRHLWFRFDEDRGLVLEPYYHMKIKLDGEERTGRRDPLCMHHGSRLTVGEAVLRMRLFAGFEDVSGAHVAAAFVDGVPADMRLPQQPPAPDAAALLLQQQATLNQQQILLMQQQLLMRQLQANGGAVPVAPDEADDEAAETVEGGEAPGQFAPPPRFDRAVSGFGPLVDDELPEGDMPCDADEPCADGAPYDGYAPQGAARRDYRGVLPPLEGDDAPYDSPYADGDPYDEAPYLSAEGPEGTEGIENPEGVEGIESPEGPEGAEGAEAYVEPDDAEKAKLLLWDRYLGRGKR